MSEILQQYWQPLLWSDGYRLTGLAMTLWLLISSVVMGGLLAIPLAIARVSPRRRFSFPVWVFTYMFRGTQLYVQLLVFYSGVYSLEIVRGTDMLNAFFRSGLNCAVLALALNTCVYTTEILLVRSVRYLMAKLKLPEPTVFPGLNSIAALFCPVRYVLHCPRTATR